MRVRPPGSTSSSKMFHDAEGSLVVNEESDRAPLESVRQLILEHVDSFEKLEILMLLGQDATRAWTVSDVRNRLNLPMSAARSALDELFVSNLLDARVGEERAFRYAPRSQQLANAVNDLASAYEQDPLAVTSFMAKTSLERLRSTATRAFADALRLQAPSERGPKSR